MIGYNDFKIRQLDLTLIKIHAVHWLAKKSPNHFSMIVLLASAVIAVV